MFRLIYLSVTLVILFVVACAGVSTDSIRDTVQDAVTFENRTAENNPAPGENNSDPAENNPAPEARASSRCDGLSIIAEYEAASAENPWRAMEAYDTETMRGCLEGTIVAFPSHAMTSAEPIAEQASSILLEVRVSEERGFVLQYAYPEQPVPSEMYFANMDSDLTPAQQAEWWARHNAAVDSYNRAMKAHEVEIIASEKRWGEFVLSASVGDKVKADCLLFEVYHAAQYDPLGEGTVKHIDCRWIEE